MRFCWLSFVVAPWVLLSCSERERPYRLIVDNSMGKYSSIRVESPVAELLGVASAGERKELKIDALSFRRVEVKCFDDKGAIVASGSSNTQQGHTVEVKPKAPEVRFVTLMQDTL